MKAKVVLDRRNDLDKKYDQMFNKMVKDANLSPKQKMVVSAYLKCILNEKIQEVENAMDMGYCIGLIEVEKFGCNKRATRLPRLRKYVREVVNKAYDHETIDANGVWNKYDGCGIERMEMYLAKHGVEFVDAKEEA